MKKFLKGCIFVLFVLVSFKLSLPVAKKKLQEHRHYFIKSPVTVTVHDLKPLDFKDLPQWSSADVVKSMEAFQHSCQVWKTMSPNAFVGSRMVNLKVKDWLPICQAAEKINHPQQEQAKLFF